ncbi:MAG: 50S ribosomal protein L11 methyltransferase [Methylacidiphilales bacterium]|nr:50S ribosomal protein L11 methyltransferase [Candidatus Methylacidiphilales bacterium]MDW8349993.1 50S ribosomal protein L11 methyltransferase [Verrucomicrobiae bacterium]
MKNTLPTHHWICRRYLHPDHAEKWIHTLPPAHQLKITYTHSPPTPRARVDFYAPSYRAAYAFKKKHGGRILRLSSLAWSPNPAPTDPPLRATRRLAICSTPQQLHHWQRKLNPSQLILITHSLAFGTGHHPTTALCLRALQTIATRQRKSPSQPPPAPCIDIGTGSGILAIAAARLGFPDVHALDHDTTALRIARYHARINHTTIRFIHADITRYPLPPASYSLIIANLYSALLTVAAPRILQALAPKGYLILSGIRTEDENEIRHAFASVPFIHRSQKENWLCLIAQAAF